jgi:hypothetical protein
MDQNQADRPLTYLAYLVRLWREGEGAPWRAMVEDPHSGERRGFGDLQSLFAFLEARTGGDTPSEEEVPAGS